MSDPREVFESVLILFLGAGVVISLFIVLQGGDPTVATETLVEFAVPVIVFAVLLAIATQLANTSR